MIFLWILKDFERSDPIRQISNLQSQTSCKPRAIELALIAEAPPMFIMQSMINLKSKHGFERSYPFNKNTDFSHEIMKKHVAWEKGTRTANAWEKGCEGSLRKRGKNSYEFFI